jgi:putative nucleotidyltransferase with HDIG domain
MPHDPFNIDRSGSPNAFGRLGERSSTVDRTRERLRAVSTNPPPADGRWGERAVSTNAHERWGERATDVESTRAMVAAVDARDPYTRVHSVSVAAYAVAIARRMGLSAAAVESLHNAALLHDVGKIGVPDAILTKPGPLTAEEFNTVKRHPEIAIEILGHLSVLADQLPLILHHHERYDGRGYPAGLVGEKIPLGARILAVADALDTMLSQRTYKPAYNVDQVRAELIACSGRQFDPAIVQATLAILDEQPSLVPHSQPTLTD